MATDERFDELISGWLEETAPQRLPERVLTATFERTRRKRQQVGWRALLGRLQMPRVMPALGGTAVVVVVAVLAVNAFVSQQRLGGPDADSRGLGIFAPLAGRIVYCSNSGLWAVDPNAQSPASTLARFEGTPDADGQCASGTEPLGWSSDGTEVLFIRKDLTYQGLCCPDHLYILRADGTETQLNRDAKYTYGATIAPDGSRVVFAAGDYRGPPSLFVIDASGGQPVRIAQGEEPTFSPDGTQIAYLSSGRTGAHVWVANADGSDAHEILADEPALAEGHFSLAWSPAGDRIALDNGLEGHVAIYTFAPDGSDFTEVINGGSGAHWSPDGSSIAYGEAPLGLSIADADGSNVRTFGFGAAGPWHPGTPSPSVESTPPPSPSLEPAKTSTVEPTEAPPSEAEVTELLNGFLESRIAGEGAQQYLNSLYPEVPWEDIPLLYATSSGAPYERAEFEPVPGIEWPYGFMAFKVRLFAGDTVVEQLFFMPHDDPQWFPADGRLGLEYQPHGFATHIAPTTEDGQPVAVTYDYFDGELTLHAAHPWVFGDDPAGGLIPQGPGVQPTTDGAQRHDGWDELVMMADPGLLATDCQPGPNATDAEALAQSIRSDPDLEATAPVAVNVGGAEAQMIDVKIATGTTVCVPTTAGGDLVGVLRPIFNQDLGWDYDDGVATGQATGEWMRLYLFDTPEGSSMRILALAIFAPKSSFDRAVEAAAPVVDSLEFHAP